MDSYQFVEPIAEHVWRTRYQWQQDGLMQEPSIAATWDRVALAVSQAEPQHRDEWRERFRAILQDFRFLPGGRILAGAGTGRSCTLFNCFVMGPIEDSVHGIFNALRESAVTLQLGGGIGLDVSTLRPAGSPAVSSAGIASGPVRFMAVWEAASAALESGNLRRGAMMATLRCDHPDIEAFIEVGASTHGRSHFNRSVLVSDDFMRALELDESWPLVFPLGSKPTLQGVEVCERVWSGGRSPLLCRVHARLPARLLWRRILQAQTLRGEPGVLFIDHINRANNLWYCEHLCATNPCGEVPLPAYGGCNLGSINLSRFVRHAFTSHPDLDFDALRAVACTATRFLDDVHDISAFPIKAQERCVRTSRRIGLGITGLADMFLMLGLRYGSPSSLDLTREIMGTLRDCAYRTSVELAQEKGPFPAFDKISYGASPFILNLSHELQDAIARHGIRNSHLLALAPAGSISLLANNVSSGIEPVLAFDGERRVRRADGQILPLRVQDSAWREFRRVHGPGAQRPEHFVQALEVPALAQLSVMAAAQACVDNAIAKTLHLPAGATEQEVGQWLRRAWELGLKGCSVYREGSNAGAPVATAR